MTVRWLVPRVSRSAVVRERLLQHDGVASDWTVLVVRGAGGTGKTTLATHLVQSPRFQDSAVVWFTADAGVSGVGFWSYLVASLVNAGVMPKALDDIEMRERGVGGWLFREIATALDRYPDPIVLVIDDLHQSDGGEALERELFDLVLAASRLRLVVLSRTLHYLDSVVAAGRSEVAIIDGADLLFTLTETSDLVTALVPDEQRTADIAAQVYEATQGWVLGTRLAAMSLAQDRGDHSLVALPASALTTELLRSRSAQERDALLNLSITDTFDRELGQVLTGLPLAQYEAMLRHLVMDGIVTVQDARAADQYRLHPVLREGLSEVLRGHHADRFTALSHTLSRHHAEHGRPRAAFVAAVDAQLWDEANAVIEQFGLIMVEDPEWYRRVGAGIPRSVLSRYPVMAGVHLMGFSVAASSPAVHHRRLLNSLVVSQTAQILGRGRPIDKVWLETAHIAARGLIGQFDAVRELTDKTDRRINELSAEHGDSMRGGLNLARGLLGHFWVYSGALGHARQRLGTVVDDAILMGDRWGAVRGLGLTALGWALEGDVANSRRALAQADSIVPSVAWVRTTLESINIARAISALDDLDYAHARQFAEHTFEHFPDVMALPIVAFLKYRAALLEPNPAERRLVLERQYREPPFSSAFFRTFRLVAEVDLALSVGDVSRASAIIKKADTGSLHVLAARSRLRYHLGEVRESLIDAERVLGTGTASPRVRAEALVSATVALLTLGRQEQAQRRANELSSVLEATDHRYALVFIPSALRGDVAALVGTSSFAGRALADDLPDPFSGTRSIARLAPRELMVLQGLAEGLTLAAIAERSGTSINTIKRQAAAVYRKLHVTDRAGAVAAGARFGLVSDDDEDSAATG